MATVGMLIKALENYLNKQVSELHDGCLHLVDTPCVIVNLVGGEIEMLLITLALADEPIDLDDHLLLRYLTHRCLGCSDCRPTRCPLGGRAHAESGWPLADGSA